jgi:hypothetical protein
METALAVKKRRSLLMAKKCSCGKCSQCKSSTKKLSPKNSKLAAMYGDKNKITRGDVITAAKMKSGKK